VGPGCRLAPWPLPRPQGAHIPIIDAIPYWIDTRVITSSFKAERTLIKDTVPVNVDAVSSYAW
jgi:regulator of protease activity HflC (stomatin/prohibitin superfamily)